MRTDKVYPEQITLSEWKKDVEEHYLPINQLSRIAETVGFVRDHCEMVRENNVATFSGVWGYLDVDKEYVEVFKKSLKDILKHSFKNLKIKYNKNGKDIIVLWG